MRPFINKYYWCLALFITLLSCSLFVIPSNSYANNNFYRQQQMMRQQQMQMQQQRAMQQRQAAMRRQQAEMQRRQAAMQRQRQRAMQQRQSAMRQQRARQQQIRQQRQAQQKQLRIARQQKLQKFQTQKKFQQQDQKQFALKQKELQKRSQIRNQQKLKARNDRLAALQKKHFSQLNKKRKTTQKRKTDTLLSLRKHLKTTSSLSPYKPARAKSSMNLAAFKKRQASNQTKARTTKQLEVQRKTVRQQLQKIAKTREHLGKKKKAGADGKKKQLSKNQKLARANFSGTQKGKDSGSGNTTKKGWLQHWEGIGYKKSLGHVIKKHVGKTSTELIDRIKSDPRISKASSFTNKTTAEFVIGRAINRNRTQINAWRRKAKPGSRLELKYTGKRAIGTGIKRGEKNTKDKKNAKIVLQMRDNGKYHILTAYPE